MEDAFRGRLGNIRPSVIKPLLLLCVCLGLANGQDTLLPKEKDYPLYEDYVFLRDYRVNQSVLDAAKFGILGAPLLGFAGFLIEGKSEFPILTFLGMVAGGTLGVVSGGVYGYLKGGTYNERKRSDAGFHAPARQVGLDFGGVAGFAKGGPFFAVTYREERKFRFLPDEYALELSGASWMSGSDTSFFVERKYGLTFTYRSRREILTPIYGAGIGYASGYEDPSHIIDDKHIILRKKNRLLLHTFLGMRLNLFDLCHGGLAIDFEPLGLYNYYEGYGNYPFGNTAVKATMGAYLF